MSKKKNKFCDICGNERKLREGTIVLKDGYICRVCYRESPYVRMFGNCRDISIEQFKEALNSKVPCSICNDETYPHLMKGDGYICGKCLKNQGVTSDLKTGTNFQKQPTGKPKLVFFLIAIVVVILIISFYSNIISFFSRANDYSFESGIASMSFSNPYSQNQASSNSDSTVNLDDINKYNEILNELQDFSRSEEEIIIEIAPKYNKTPTELTDFMNRVMPYATGIKEIINPNIPSNDQLILCIELALNDMINNGDILFPTSENQWSIDKTNLRYIMSSSMLRINNNYHDILIKIEFTDFSYQSFTVFQIKVDDKNISLD